MSLRFEYSQHLLRTGDIFLVVVLLFNDLEKGPSPSWVQFPSAKGRDPTVCPSASLPGLTVVTGLHVNNAVEKSIVLGLAGDGRNMVPPAKG